MKQLKTLLTQLLVIGSLMLPWAAAEALETFSDAGAITKYSYDRFVLNGNVYRVSPDAKFPTSDRSNYKTFKVGDVVYIKGKILNGIRYVDRMQFFPPEPS
ncbi:MAG: hypothetical protein JSU67_01760 [Gammaproteobacteria bacterium]|nr:MAG: hypothetical protein EP300_06335 [Gammaproteobacteria bacterium]UCH40456.1 MAG: hypothetical protein JSU67_01760 [Gammaproteobacteria bacterium]